MVRLKTSVYVNFWFSLRDLRLALIAILSLTSFRIANADSDRLPYLISIHPPQVGDAWLQVVHLIKENEQLEKPQPDPYLARAELWTTVGNHEEAVEDYLKAIQLSMANKPNLIEQSRLLGLMRASLDRLVRQPRPMFPIEAAASFEIGLSMYRRGDYKEASAFLAESTRLNPTDAVYRAIRALNYRRLLNDSDAAKQLAAAAGILRDPDTPEFERVGFHIQLESIQFSDRYWLSSGIRSAGLNRSPKQPDAKR